MDLRPSPRPVQGLSDDALDALLVPTQRAADHPHTPTPTRSAGPPLPRLARAPGVSGIEEQAADAAPVVSDDGLTWLLDPEAEGEWCPPCGGPCRKRSWWRTVGVVLAFVFIAVPSGLALGLAGGLMWIMTVNGESLSDIVDLFGQVL